MDCDGDCGLNVMTGLQEVKTNLPDRLAIEKIVRQVLARLNGAGGNSDQLTPKAGSTLPVPAESSKTSRTASYLADRVITADKITRLPKHILVTLICNDAVITPSAIDEAKTRGIEINRVQRTEQRNPSVQECVDWIMDKEQPERGNAVANQLKKRGINTPMSRIVLSDTPAKELDQQIRVRGEVAAVVGSIEEAKRFSLELDVTTWVFDMQRLNLIAAVNVASVIAMMANSRTANSLTGNTHTGNPQQ